MMHFYQSFADFTMIKLALFRLKPLSSSLSASVHTTQSAVVAHKAHTNKHKKIILILLMLSMMAYAMPSRASIFDPLLKVITPIYQKVTGTYDDKNAQTDEPIEQVDDLAAAPSENKDVSLEALLGVQDGADWLSNTEESPSLEAILHAEFAYDRDNPRRALAIYKQQAFKQNATAVFERALALSLQLESAEQSLQFAKAWQERYPDHIPAWFYVTHLSLKAGDYATTADSLQKILQYDQKADLSGIFAGILPTNAKAQRKLFDALMKIDNADNASLAALKAALLVQLNEIDVAILHINHAISLDGNNLALNILKADILKNTNRYDALNDFLDEARTKTSEPTKKQLTIYQIRTMIDLGDLTGAWEYLLPATKRYADDGDLLLLGGLVALDLQNYDDANRLLTAMLNNPQLSAVLHSQAYYYLGLSHERTHDYNKARGYYERVTDAAQKLEAVRRVVEYYLMEDNTAKAMDALIALRRDYPMFAADSYLLQADILVRQNHKSAAISLLTGVFDDYPDDTRLLFSANTLLDDDQNYDEKLNNINKLVELEPSPLYQLEQARLVLLRTPNDAHALQIAEEFSTDLDGDIRTQAQVLLADKELAAGQFEAVVDRLADLYHSAPSLAAGSRLLRAYNGLGDEHMVDSMLLDLTVRFGQDNNFESSVQDY